MFERFLNATALVFALLTLACEPPAPKPPATKPPAPSTAQPESSRGGDTSGLSEQEEALLAAIDTVPEETGGVKPVLSRPSAQAMEVLLDAIGCEDGFPDLGCGVCPDNLQSDELSSPHPLGLTWRTPSIVVFGGESERHMDVFAGPFAHGEADHMLLYAGCRLDDDPAHERPNDLYLVSSGKLVGVLEGYKQDTRMEECAFPRDTAGKAHVLCVQARGRQGVESLDILRVHTPTTGREEYDPQHAGLENMPQLNETEGEFSEDGETLDMPDWHRLTFAAVRDVDGDGDEDVLVDWGDGKRWVLVQGAGGTFEGEAIE